MAKEANPSNPPCIECGSSKVSPNRYLKSGSIQYRCRECGKTWTPNKKPHPRAGGGKPKYMDRPLTNAEHQKLWRRRQRLKKGKTN